MRIKKAVIPVAGLGTRMLPATKAIPKELLPIVDKPLIQFVVEEAISGGIDEIIFVTRSGKEAIENHFDENYELEKYLEKSGKTKILKTIKNLIPKNIKIYSVRQEKALGLGHAILCAKALLKGEDFAVLLPDEILFTKRKKNDFSRMISSYNKTGKGQILVEKVQKSELINYGVVNLDKKELSENTSQNILNVVEKPLKNPPSNFRVVGRYVLPHKVLSILETCSPDKNGEIQLTEALDKISKKNHNDLKAILSTSNIFDCGSKKGFIGANILRSLEDKDLKKYIKEILD